MKLTFPKLFRRAELLYYLSDAYTLNVQTVLTFLNTVLLLNFSEINYVLVDIFVDNIQLM